MNTIWNLTTPSGAGRWPFLRPPRPSVVTDRDPRGLPGCIVGEVVNHPTIDPRDLRVFFEAPATGAETPRESAAACAVTKTWASASLEVRLFTPLHRHLPARPLPRAEARFGPTAPPVSTLVPPAWFRTTSTVSSARRSWACCIPLPVMGFVPLHRATAPRTPRSTGTNDRDSRDAGSHPSKTSPRRQPHRVTPITRVHRWPLPSCRYRAPGAGHLAKRPLPVSTFSVLSV